MLQTLKRASADRPEPGAASWRTVEYPTVDEIKLSFRHEGFLIFVNKTADGYLAPSVNMHPLRPGRLAGPVGSGTTPEQAAFHAWAMFEDNREDYVGVP